MIRRDSTTRDWSQFADRSLSDETFPMPALSYYTNVHDTAVALLERKGFQVWFEPETDLYFAERDGWDFAADDPVALLGVVAIYEAAAPSEHKEYWWRDRAAEGVTRRLPEKPRRNYVSVIDRKV